MGQASAAREVTRQRRELILQAIEYLGTTWDTPGRMTAGVINDVLLEWIRSSTILWPKAPWDNDVGLPYAVGTSQHLRAMEAQSRIRWDEKRLAWVVVGLPAGRLRHRAADVLRLKSEGKDGVAIAEELGISKSLAYSLLNDPTGEKERERKRSYCPACGARREPEAVTCGNCRSKKAEELLPPETYVRYCERARDAGYEIAFGVTPDFSRVLRVRIGQRILDHEVRSDLAWLDGLRELEDELGVQLVD